MSGLISIFRRNEFMNDGLLTSNLLNTLFFYTISYQDPKEAISLQIGWGVLRNLVRPLLERAASQSAPLSVAGAHLLCLSPALLGFAKCCRGKLRNLFGVLWNVLITHMPRQRHSQKNAPDRTFRKGEVFRNILEPACSIITARLSLMD